MNSIITSGQGNVLNAENARFQTLFLNTGNDNDLAQASGISKKKEDISKIYKKN
jgi:hypothetical protein